MKSKEVIITSAMVLLITYTLSLSLVSQTFPQTQTNKTLSSSGTIITSASIEVYSDYQCNYPLSNIPWGTLEPGDSQEYIIYIKNVGNTAATLGLQTSNWNPASATNYLTLSWNYLDQQINPDNSIRVRLTLNVDQDISGIETFGFNIIIVAQ